jgi:hypothetical protein
MVDVGSMTYPGVPNLERIEWIVLADCWAFTLAEDRSPGAVAPLDCNPLSGLPKDEDPRPIMDPVTGFIRMSLGSKILPVGLAKGGMNLATSIILFAGSEDGEGGRTGGLAANHSSLILNGRKRAFSDIPMRDWSLAMLSHWREFAFRIRKVFGKWASLGLGDPCPVIFEVPEKLGIDLLPRVFRPSYRLIEHARQVIPGTPWANRPKSILHDLTASERASQPQYARESFLKEAGGSGATPLIDPGPVAETPVIATPEAPKTAPLTP